MKFVTFRKGDGKLIIVNPAMVEAIEEPQLPEATEGDPAKTDLHMASGKVFEITHAAGPAQLQVEEALSGLVRVARRRDEDDD